MFRGLIWLLITTILLCPQTLAILRYLAQKHDLSPQPGAETIRSDIGEQAAMEMMLSMFRAWYVKEEMFASTKAMLLDYLPSKLEQTVQFLGDRKFILGDRVTYVDFLFYSTLDYIRLFQASLFDNHQPLKDYLARIEALPAIEKYIKNGSFSRFPITGPMAMFGGQRE